MFSFPFRSIFALTAPIIAAVAATVLQWTLPPSNLKSPLLVLVLLPLEQDIHRNVEHETNAHATKIRSESENILHRPRPHPHVTEARNKSKNTTPWPPPHSTEARSESETTTSRSPPHDADARSESETIPTLPPTPYLKPSRPSRHLYSNFRGASDYAWSLDDELDDEGQIPEYLLSQAGKVREMHREDSGIRLYAYGSDFGYSGM
ncbi:hypothetical protein EJ04DRAFT_511204 [Polyplosphaeria fusca]|uniref:Uncharacterized protein n=1 Tax=Polyplosphaeria fusca TaxID=682080 RepID=A0A9P4R3M0_9PLEO|nr:hypothetical protein EJ04DRAFT_511204 [Polyplosphaeria fusca]